MQSFNEWKQAGNYVHNKEFTIPPEPGICCGCGTATYAKLMRYCPICYDIEAARLGLEKYDQEETVLRSTSGLEAVDKDQTLFGSVFSSDQQLIGKILKREIKNISENTSWKLPYFYGPNGIGKSWLATAALNDFIRRGRSVYYLYVPKIMGDLDKFKIHEERMMKADILCLDDIGHHGTHQYTLANLQTVLDCRLRSRKSTMIISNFSVEDLTNKLENDNEGIQHATILALKDRLKELCTEITVSGKSRRDNIAFEDYKRVALFED